MTYNQPTDWSTDPDRVSQCKRHSQRQSFRHCDNKHGHTNDEELDKLVDVSVRPWHVTYGKHLDAERQHQNAHCSYRYARAYNINGTL